MSVTNNQVAHVYATYGGGPLVVVREDGCQFTRAAQGRWLVTLPTGFGSAAGNFKITTNVEGLAGAATIVNVDWLTQTTFEVLTWTQAGVAEDVDAIWVTVEIVPRVS